MDDNPLRVALLEVEYAAFNAKRSLGTLHVRHAQVLCTSDGVQINCPEASDDSYLNRLVSTTTPQGIPAGVLRVDRVVHDSGGASLRILTGVPRAEGRHDGRVTRYDATRGAEFLRIVESTAGQALGDSVIAAKSRFYCSDEFRCFVAKADGEVCGIATMYVNRGVGWLANAFTFPQARRLGVHHALLEARLADALKLGLREVYTDVVPGTASERNLLRAGFKQFAYYSSEPRDT